MQLKNSETVKNLAKSFALEAVAGLKYQFLAEIFNQQGYYAVSEEIKNIAKNETKHAKVFYDHIVNGGGKENVEFSLTSSFFENTVEELLKLSIKTENEEAFVLYPQFASVAEKEGFSEIAKSFLLIAEVEKEHKDRFVFLSEKYSEESLFKAPKPTFFVCSECGHKETLTSAWEVCPLCGATQGYVDLLLP